MSLSLPAQPLRSVDWLTLEEVPFAVVKHHGVRLEDLVRIFDQSFGALGAAIAAGELAPAGPAVALYTGNPDAEFDLSVGFPVAEPLTGHLEQSGARIEHDHLLAGSYAALSHVGSYDGLAGSWEVLLEEVKEGGARTSGQWAEVYVTEPSPEADPATMRTDLLIAVVVDTAV